MAKRKVTRENFYVIQRYFRNNHTMEETKWRFGLSSFTISMINKSTDYDDYVAKIKENHKESYQARKGTNMFGKSVHIPDEEPAFKSSTVYGSPFTETTVREGSDGSRTIVQRPIGNAPAPVYPLSRTKLIKACEEARYGTPMVDIARMLGFKNAADFSYALKKDAQATEEFYEAFAQGETRRLEIVNKRRADARKNSRAKANSTIKVKKKITASEKGKNTAAKNKGMTPEEYHQWQVENLARARAKKFEKEGKKPQPVSIPKPAEKKVEEAKEILKKEMNDFDNNVKTEASYLDNERCKINNEIMKAQAKRIRSEAFANRVYSIAVLLIALGLLGFGIAFASEVILKGF